MADEKVEKFRYEVKLANGKVVVVEAPDWPTAGAMAVRQAGPAMVTDIAPIGHRHDILVIPDEDQ
jgi:hypothetical protein